MLLWQVCNECCKSLTRGDPTMGILLIWANEVCAVNQLPKSLKDNPLKQAIIVQVIDKFLNLNMRIRFGNRFPSYLIDTSETEKKYFLSELANQSVIKEIFLPDVKDDSRRNSIVLKLWVGATIAAKPTRPVYNVLGGQQPYELKDRIAGFREADGLASSDEIVRSGVQIAPILELLIRPHNVISLEGSVDNSEVRRYIKRGSTIQQLTPNDLQI
jgi:hypothetical protein